MASIQTPHGVYEGPPPENEWTIGVCGIFQRTLCCGDTGPPDSCPPSGDCFHNCVFGSCERFGHNAVALTPGLAEDPTAADSKCYMYSVCCCLGSCTSSATMMMMNPCVALYVCGYRSTLRAKYNLPVTCCCLPWCDGYGCCGCIGDTATHFFCGPCAECQMTHEVYARGLSDVAMAPAEGSTEPLIGNEAPGQQHDIRPLRSDPEQDQQDEIFNEVRPQSLNVDDDDDDLNTAVVTRKPKDKGYGCCS